MHLVPMPGCCAAKILTGFGGTDTAEYDYRPDKDFTDETMFQAIVDKLEEAHRGGNALVFAATNSAQEVANRVLPRAGFIKVDETAKVKHQEHLLIGWVFRLNLADKVRPLKVPANPFIKKEKEEPIRGIVADMAVWDEILADGAQAGIPAPRQIFQVNPAPVVNPRRANAQGFINPADLGEYEPIASPVRDRQLWNAFVPRNNQWMKIISDANDGEALPEDQHFRIRSGKVGTVDWWEIHPDDQGRVTMAAVGEETRLTVRLVGDERPLPDRRRRQDWSWTRHRNDEGRVDLGCITHFKI